ncbi:MAG: GNAT family N-acetyltransferase [Ignavibacteriales bacterium]
MSEIIIEKLGQSKSDLKKFLKFAFKIYENDKYWVPPLFIDKLKLLSKEKNPFFKVADMDLFMAKIGNEYVGRIAAIENRTHNKIHNDKVGFFGFFECINNQEVANKLFDTAKEWLRNKGCESMRGPANPSSNDEYGLLIEGFDDSPRIMMTYNPKYYMDLIDNYGFHKAKDLFAYRIDNEKLCKSEKLVRIAELAKQRSKLVLKQIDMKNFKSELEKIKFVYNKAWAPNWGFVPLTDEEIDHLAKDLKPLVEPSLVLFGEVDGKVVGFALVMLDYNEIFKDFKGRLLPFNFIKLFTQKKKITWARVLTLGLIPEFQKKGLDATFYYEIMKRAEKVNILKGEASWILEDNDMMNRGAIAMNGELYKKYRIYEIPV